MAFNDFGRKGEVMTGKVKSYNPSTRYGFITADGVDYRFHHNEWGMRLPPMKGIGVEFAPYETEKGLRATEIRRVNHGKE